ncbi:PASTA domain-containing protein [Kineosporia sp. NBRC 101731]|uniref:PASTA domain-containing protein n=1 Tax=Kineosporia sp. NBRC 101731 TaxID=3032199 RepID=UPI0024A23312|nr:PASTA domain-containing protein [Kineosporia sp. NBRC 101731]GLY27180.1 hypothetical protein Kisp02_05450 [Kineosporia sp. NBRC 101731]
MRAIRITLSTFLLGPLLVACGGGGAQVGSIGSTENPPAEQAAATRQSERDLADQRERDREDDPRTAQEQRREEARDVANKVKEVADDVKKGITQSHFTMPQLVGRNLQNAQDLLQKRGSYLLDQVDATSQHRFQLLDSDWKVCHQSPRAGSRVLKTKLVRLEAVRLDENCP